MGAYLTVFSETDYLEPSTGRKAQLLAIYSLLIALRSPWLLIHGRLWAEEGFIYFVAAWSGNVCLDLLAAHQGYYSLFPNAVSVLTARVFPLPFAALVTTWCAFLVQIAAGYLVVQCESFASVKAKILALGVLLLTAPSFEVWLNTTNSQFYFVVCVAIIFISRPDRLRLQRNLVLAIAALTGPVTTFLVPFFLARAYFAKIKGAWQQASVLTTCALLQIVVVLRNMHSGARHVVFQPSGLAPEFLVNYITMPFLGRAIETVVSALILNQSRHLAAAHVNGANLISTLLNHHLPLTPPFLAIWGVLDILFIAVLAWVTEDKSDRSSWWLLTMAVWLAIASMSGSLGGTYSIAERYAFPSAVLMGFSLLLTAFRATTGKTRRTAAKCLLAIFLLSGSLDYFYYPRWMAYERPAGPDWYIQARQWEHDPAQKLSIWPRAIRLITLPPDHY